MLPEFANGRAFPAAPWFGSALNGGNQQRKMLANVGKDSGSGSLKIETPRQLIRKECDIQRVAEGQAFGQIGMGFCGP